jgi:hypothetical protein
MVKILQETPFRRNKLLKMVGRLDETQSHIASTSRDLC